jgi:NAD+ synthase
MKRKNKFYSSILDINCNEEIQNICNFISKKIFDTKKEGVIVGLSGGIDSAVAASLCVKTLGKEKVFGLILPEKDSEEISEIYAKKEAERLGISYQTIDITTILASIGTYSKRDDYVKSLFPDYDESYSLKLSLPSDLLNKDSLNVFFLTLKDSKGNISKVRLSKKNLQGIVAATNTKQRTRMIQLYHYAESKNYLVCGTTNLTEYIQGFFVKYGDGGVDIEPLVHLYKTQIYQLANSLGVIDEIVGRNPSPDTFNFHVSDEEFYFQIPFKKLDMLLYAWEHRIPINTICKVLDLTEKQVTRVFRNFSLKHKATEHQRKLPPNLIPKN